MDQTPRERARVAEREDADVAASGSFVIPPDGEVFRVLEY
jgi:hypothetical protein